MKRISKFSITVFFVILGFVIFPVFTVNIFCQNRLENILQEKLNDSVIQNISSNQRYINEALMEMAYFSNIFVNDDELRERIETEDYSQYENMQYFNHILSRDMVGNSSYIRNNAKVILFDNFGRVYSNWSLNYRNYQFILQEDWVERSKEKNGHIEWSLFQPSYIEEEKGKKYISLARTFLENKTDGKAIGTLIVSISQDDVSKLMMQYAYEKDQACICIDDGEILLTTKGDIIDEEIMKRIYRQTLENEEGMLKEKIDQKEYLISYSTFPYPWRFGEHEMKLFHFTDYSPVNEQMKDSMMEIHLVTYCSLVLVVMFSFFLSKKMLNPITTLTNKMKNYDLNEAVTGLDLERNDEIGSLNRGFVQMDTRIQKLFRQLEEESKIKEKYHYESLRAQLSPHFLFNTLNSIRWLAIIRRADNIVESIDAVSSILKYSLAYEDSLVTLADEIQHIRNYIYIHSLRYAEMIQLHIDIKEEFLQYRTLKFILQPIVENAVLHGFGEEQASLDIEIKGWQEMECLYLSVADNGIGVTTEFVRYFEEERRQKKTGRLTGIGLEHVDAYIRIRFGETYGLQLKKRESGGTVVLFCLPVIWDDGRGRESYHEKGYDSGR